MKEDIHPEYNPVVFIDAASGQEYVTRAAMKAKETKTIDGVEHYVVKCDVTAASHPFYTGKQRFMDTKGRLDRFRRRYTGGGNKKSEESPDKPAE